jgi:hypothetical protein
MNDAELQQDWTTKYHNMFGAKLSRVQGTTCIYPHKVWKGKTNFNHPNLGLERSIWND